MAWKVIGLAGINHSDTLPWLIQNSPFAEATDDYAELNILSFKTIKYEKPKNPVLTKHWAYKTFSEPVLKELTNIFQLFQLVTIPTSLEKNVWIFIDSFEMLLLMTMITPSVFSCRVETIISYKNESGLGLNPHTTTSHLWLTWDKISMSFNFIMKIGRRTSASQDCW